MKCGIYHKTFEGIKYNRKKSGNLIYFADSRFEHSHHFQFLIDIFCKQTFNLTIKLNILNCVSVDISLKKHSLILFVAASPVSDWNQP